MKTIGLIPASGSASRIGGLPKFSLPISDKSSLLSWHVDNLLKICDEVRVCTQSKWIPLIESMNLDISLISKEPSTLTDALISLAIDSSDRYIFTMPDTYYFNIEPNFMSNIFDIPAEIVLGCFICPPNLKGKVGQVEILNSQILAARDKDISCSYEHMWGYMGFKEGAIQNLDPLFDTPALLIDKWVNSGISVGANLHSGEYMDVGTFDGVKRLYNALVD